MLMVSTDRRLDPQAAGWVVRTIIEGVRSSAADLVVGESLADRALAAAPHRASVVALDPCESDSVQRTTAAAAAGVVWVTAGSGRGLRDRLSLSTGSAARVPLALVVVADHAVDTAELRLLAGAQAVRAVPYTPARRPERTLRRLGRSLGSLAAAPQRMDGADRTTRRESAAAAAADRLRELLGEDGVEEFQIRGGESMVVEFSNGERQNRPSPFLSDDELIGACRFLAAYSGERPQRFDELDPRLDTRIGDRWRLHAEAFVCSPPTLVLRSNLGGRRTLAELGLCSDQLAEVLVEAIAGDVRANVVVAAAMGGGKTTLCQALLARVPPTERIDTIEDTPELRLREYGIHPNAYERLTRDANNDGVGKHSMADHVRDAKRANSSKLVVGEVRGEGTMALLDAMSSGLDGCIVTLHSPPGDGVMEKLTAYATSEGADEGLARRSIAIAVHLLVWMGRNNAGERVIADVTQITGTGADGTIQTRCLWRLPPNERWATPVDQPVGRMADVYRSAGAAVHGPAAEAAPRRPILQLVGGDSSTANRNGAPQ
ncbi:MAG: CpaF family protein [Acidimicrobiaceae bacterium]|nr:CpaF family protein [Acidimicrobiaceae bacterium]